MSQFIRFRRTFESKKRFQLQGASPTAPPPNQWLYLCTPLGAPLPYNRYKLKAPIKAPPETKFCVRRYCYLSRFH